MPVLQFPADGQHRAPVSPAVQSDFGQQPPQAFGGVAVDHERCKLSTGCDLLQYGTVCGALCYARLIADR